MASDRLVRVYGRENCSLCDEAMRILKNHQARYRFRIEYVDIETDEELHARYFDVIPVIAIGGAERLLAPIYAARVADELEDAFGGSQS